MNTDILFWRSYPINGGDFDKAGDVSSQIKSILKELGVDRNIVRRVAIATFEAEMNVVIHARSDGQVKLSLTMQDILLEVTDDGRGIEDIEQAMQEGWSTATDQMREMGFGAGMGLPNIKKNTDEMRISSELGKGTKLDLRIHHKMS